MQPSFAQVREFIRRVYRDGGANSTTRSTYLDDLADTAMDAQQKGKMLIGSSDKGTSANYLAFSGWSPDFVLTLIDEVRGYITESTAELALTAYRGSPVKGIVTIRTICRWGSGYGTTP